MRSATARNSSTKYEVHFIPLHVRSDVRDSCVESTASSPKPIEFLQSIDQLRRCEVSFGQLPKIYQLPIEGDDCQGLLREQKINIIVSLLQFDTLVTEVCYSRYKSTRLLTSVETCATQHYAQNPRIRDATAHEWR